MDLAVGGLRGAGVVVTAVDLFRFFESRPGRAFCRAAQFPEGTNFDFGGLPAAAFISEAASAIFRVVELMDASPSLVRHAAEISSPKSLGFVVNLRTTPFLSDIHPLQDHHFFVLLRREQVRDKSDHGSISMGDTAARDTRESAEQSPVFTIYPPLPCSLSRDSPQLEHFHSPSSSTGPFSPLPVFLSTTSSSET